MKELETCIDKYKVNLATWKYISNLITNSPPMDNIPRLYSVWVSMRVTAPKSEWRDILHKFRKGLRGKWVKQYTTYKDGVLHITWGHRIDKHSIVFNNITKTLIPNSFDIDLFLQQPMLEVEQAVDLKSACVKIEVGEETKIVKIERVICFDENGNPIIDDNDPDREKLLKIIGMKNKNGK